MSDEIKPAFPTIYPPCKNRNDSRLAVDKRITTAVRKAEAQLGMRVFCLLHHRQVDADIDSISPWLYGKILKELPNIPRGKPIAILLDSPGGDAHSAYRIAKAFARHCCEYMVLIPRYAKSAATLFSLGASTIYLGEHAEIGPIDVQVDDPEHERRISALEVVQSLERLNSEAMQAMDQMMALLLRRTGKRVDTLLKPIMKYATDLARPLFEKIDTIDFTYHARQLKIGEDYSKWLLSMRYPKEVAESISIALARGYPDHGFVIDFEEAERIGLEVAPFPDNLREPLGFFLPSYTRNTVIGFLEDIPDANPKKEQTPPVASAPAAAEAGKDQPASGVSGKRRASNRIGKNGPTEPMV